MRAVSVAGAAFVLAFSLLLSAFPVSAQMDPAVRDRVVSASVQIALLAAERDDPKRAIFLPAASGTVVSPDGLILTNQHVVDEPTNRAALERYSASVGIAYDLLPRFLILATYGGDAPLPSWEAEVVAQDAGLDLAVLRVVEDYLGNPLPADPGLPFVELGDSDALQLGDPIDVFGYPTVGGDSLTYTSGSVSGFLTQEGIAGRAWIKTDAVVSGGSSGGTAVDRAGRLVGVPTQGTFLDCRPVDANGDGATDAADGGCLPTGGSIGELRPVNLALPLLDRAGFRKNGGAVDVSAAAPVEAQPTSTPSTTTAEAFFGIKVCADFASADEAQRFLDDHPGADQLDRDGDGVPCEELWPSEQPSPTPVGTRSVPSVMTIPPKIVNPGCTAINSSERVFFRSSPGGDVITSLDPRTVVEVLGDEITPELRYQQWAIVRLQDGSTGYVPALFVPSGTTPTPCW